MNPGILGRLLRFAPLLLILVALGSVVAAVLVGLPSRLKYQFLGKTNKNKTLVFGTFTSAKVLSCVMKSSLANKAAQELKEEG